MASQNSQVVGVQPECPLESSPCLSASSSDISCLTNHDVKSGQASPRSSIGAGDVVNDDFFAMERDEFVDGGAENSCVNVAGSSVTPPAACDFPGLAQHEFANAVPVGLASLEPEAPQEGPGEVLLPDGTVMKKMEDLATAPEDSEAPLDDAEQWASALDCKPEDILKFSYEDIAGPINEISLPEPTIVNGVFPDEPEVAEDSLGEVMDWESLVLPDIYDFCASVESSIPPGRTGPKRKQAEAPDVSIVAALGPVPVKVRSKRRRGERLAWSSQLLCGLAERPRSQRRLKCESGSALDDIQMWDLLSPEDADEEECMVGSKRVSQSVDGGAVRRCTHCSTTKTPQWRAGPQGPKTLCNACGVRYKSGRLCPEYRPASSPEFEADKHSNSHRKIVEMRKLREHGAPEEVVLRLALTKLPIGQRRFKKPKMNPVKQVQVRKFSVEFEKGVQDGTCGGASKLMNEELKADDPDTCSPYGSDSGLEFDSPESDREFADAKTGSFQWHCSDLDLKDESAEVKGVELKAGSHDLDVVGAELSDAGLESRASSPDLKQQPASLELKVVSTCEAQGLLLRDAGKLGSQPASRISVRVVADKKSVDDARAACAEANSSLVLEVGKQGSLSCALMEESRQNLVAKSNGGTGDGSPSAKALALFVNRQGTAGKALTVAPPQSPAPLSKACTSLAEKKLLKLEALPTSPNTPDSKREQQALGESAGILSFSPVLPSRNGGTVEPMALEAENGKHAGLAAEGRADLDVLSPVGKWKGQTVAGCFKEGKVCGDPAKGKGRDAQKPVKLRCQQPREEASVPKALQQQTLGGYACSSLIYPKGLPQVPFIRPPSFQPQAQEQQQLLPLQSFQHQLLLQHQLGMVPHTQQQQLLEQEQQQEEVVQQENVKVLESSDKSGSLVSRSLASGLPPTPDTPHTPEAHGSATSPVQRPASVQVLSPAAALPKSPDQERLREQLRRRQEIGQSMRRERQGQEVPAPGIPPAHSPAKVEGEVEATSESIPISRAFGPGSGGIRAGKLIRPSTQGATVSSSARTTDRVVPHAARRPMQVKSANDQVAVAALTGKADWPWEDSTQEMVFATGGIGVEA